MILILEEIKKQSEGRSWNYLFQKYLENISLFLNGVTTKDYIENLENPARMATVKLSSAILTGEEKYIFECVDHWGQTCFDYFRKEWLKEKDAEWERSKVSDRMNWNSLEKYSWEE